MRIFGTSFGVAFERGNQSQFQQICDNVKAKGLVMYNTGIFLNNGSGNGIWNLEMRFGKIGLGNGIGTPLQDPLIINDFQFIYYFMQIIEQNKSGILFL